MIYMSMMAINRVTLVLYVNFKAMVSQRLFFIHNRKNSLKFKHKLVLGLEISQTASSCHDPSLNS